MKQLITLSFVLVSSVVFANGKLAENNDKEIMRQAKMNTTTVADNSTREPANTDNGTKIESNSVIRNSANIRGDQ